MSSRPGLQGNQRANADGSRFLSIELYLTDEASVKTRLVRWVIMMDDGNVLM